MPKIPLLVVGCLLLAGCPVQPQTEAQLTDRLKNATEINDESSRDASLRQVALDAANFRWPSVAQNAITAMAQSTQRDETAEQAADVFDDQGNRPSAETMVSLINDGARRDRMRSKFAADPMKLNTDVTRP